ncbi:MAG: helix-turn-helix domain-containing protein [Sulfurimonas sp.]|nr:helix-turn-helix domain-containing protein [Sulfurimonas sp.]MBU3939566.1 helix-turn-helix domain-containing protein [bacterium]MBU4023646.1 helix-turn-helix domain-containing protein [bacterium]MBU4059942.1 helix-turn-helix domain-containing protein [bacterium]MBU4110612.1 helix-turn-helix domain-containing protein [bacterium]
MSENFTKLKEIGLAEISEQTHISKQHIEALIQENFKALKKVQFLGFLSILERDYQLDLSELKERGLKFYSDAESVKPASVFVEKRSKKSSKGIYVLIALIIFILAIYYSLGSDKTDIEVNATQVQSVTQEIEVLVEDNISEKNSSAFENNTSSEFTQETDVNATSETIQAELDLSAQEMKSMTNSLKIIANSKLWFGYIELGTENKTQKVFSGDLDLDASKNLLLLFGHNNVEVELNGEKQEFEKNKNLQFLYKDGKLTQISLDEFKKLNKGNKW